MKQNQKFGHGNFALAGHTMANQNLLFTPLHSIKKGDMIYITDDEDLYLFMGYKDDETAIFSDHRNQEKFEVKLDEIKNQMQGIENDAVNVFIQLPKR